MTREDLKALKLEKEAIDKIMELNGETIEAEKLKFEAKIKELEGENSKNAGLLSAANEKIKSFDGMDIEKISAEATKWKTDYDALLILKEQELLEIRFEGAFEKALTQAKAKNTKAVAALFDKSKISLDGDNLLGFDEQIKLIKPEHEYLFEDEKPKPKFTIPTGGGSPPVSKKWGELSFSEKLALKQDSPEEYKYLKGEK